MTRGEKYKGDITRGGKPKGGNDQRGKRQGELTGGKWPGGSSLDPSFM